MKIIVIGSGIAGAHAALTLLERKRPVELWDVGREETSFPDAGRTITDLKDSLDDPVSYFLGSEMGALVPPGSGELLRYPPSRSFLADREDPLWDYLPSGFVPFASFSRGGLANGWGANALSFDDDDMADWPVSFAEMEAAYRKVYARVPVAGPEDADDLTPYLNGVYQSQPPVELSAADRRLLFSYEKHRNRLNTLGVRIGRARLAVITDSARQDHCDYCDRCLWGCPRAAIYNPAKSTLKACEADAGFRYVPGRFVLSLLSSGDKVSGLRYLDLSTQEIREEACDVVFLAAGALQSGAIFLRTLKAARPDIAPETDGLMDTTVVKLPFLAINRIGAVPEPRQFQFNRLNMGVVGKRDAWPRYLHGEVLNLSSLLFHPLIESLPLDSRFAKQLFFTLKTALGAVTLFFPDKIASGNRQVLVEDGGRWPQVRLEYREQDEKEVLIRQSVSRVRSALWRLGCIPRGAARSPIGGGIHYAGTVPMGAGPKRCNARGQSNLFSNLYIADGAAFPSLPSKSISMSLAAHATRVATSARV